MEGNHEIDTVVEKQLRFPFHPPFAPIVWEKPESELPIKWETFEK